MVSVYLEALHNILDSTLLNFLHTPAKPSLTNLLYLVKKTQHF